MPCRCRRAGRSSATFCTGSTEQCGRLSATAHAHALVTGATRAYNVFTMIVAQRSLISRESGDMAGSSYDGPLPSARWRLASRRTCGDVVLCGVTLAELSLLVFATPTLTALDWIYVLQHVIVLGVALTRRPPRAQDLSWPA